MKLSRRWFVGLLAAAALTRSAKVALAEETIVTVHKDPNCGCCTGWVKHLRDAGFTVQVDETSDLEPVRVRLGVPTGLAACHTAEVDGYVIEGHVPASAIRRLLCGAPTCGDSRFPECRSDRRAWKAVRPNHTP
jgi:hypothetical protein